MDEVVGNSAWMWCKFFHKAPFTRSGVCSNQQGVHKQILCWIGAKRDACQFLTHVPIQFVPNGQGWIHDSSMGSQVLMDSIYCTLGYLWSLLSRSAILFYFLCTWMDLEVVGCKWTQVVCLHLTAHRAAWSFQSSPSKLKGGPDRKACVKGP